VCSSDLPLHQPGVAVPDIGFFLKRPMIWRCLRVFINPSPHLLLSSLHCHLHGHPRFSCPLQPPHLPHHSLLFSFICVINISVAICTALSNLSSFLNDVELIEVLMTKHYVFKICAVCVVCCVCVCVCVCANMYLCGV